ncbi:MAG: FCD domain-containing protein [Armatimonadetes bacterium]|nr:FCD domain-containing protein [Armatimonadota bacterium]
MNTRFHRAIVGASGNDRLIALYNQVLDEMRGYRLRSLTLRGGWSRSIEEHAAVLAAVEAGDAAARLRAAR